MKALRIQNWAWLLPVLLGVAAFLLVLGPRILAPTNIGWLGAGDPAQHYLGWSFFRRDAWRFPLGLNPGYGLELSNAIVYSDSNPLLAFLFKPFSSWLPEPFQYFGIWLLLCFVLQAYFAWKLVGLLSGSPAIRLLGAGIFVFSPPMIWRLHGFIGHLSLAGHFLVLAALFLVFRPGTRHRLVHWGLLLTVTALVHAYLLAIVGLLWLADLAERLYRQEQLGQATAVEFFFLGSIVSLVCWQAGYFAVGKGLVSEGYGFYKMNALALIDPGKSNYGNWSYLLADLTGDEIHHEGFNFLGLGVIVLLIFSIRHLVAHGRLVTQKIVHRPFVVTALVLLTLFSMTHHLSFGTHVLELPINDSFLKAANTFRASARMFWGTFYSIVFVLLFIVIRYESKTVATALLALAFGTQLTDTHAGWQVVRKRFMSTPTDHWTSPMRHPFWSQAAKHYSHVRVAPPSNPGYQWMEVAYYAATHGMTTNAAYLARVNAENLQRAIEQMQTTLTSGQFDLKTLYILTDASVGPVRASINPQHDLLIQLDGFWVLAPGWNVCRDCPAVSP